MKPLLSVLIVSFQSSALALAAIDSILADGKRDFPLEIIVVDNNSDLAQRKILQEASPPPQVRRFFLESNLGYGPGNNFAYEQSQGDYLLVINPDTLVFPGALKTMLDHLASRPRCAAVGPKTYWDEDRAFLLPPSEIPTFRHLLLIHLAHCFHPLGRLLDRQWLRSSLRHWRKRRPTAVNMLSGGCFMTSRAVVKDIGLFDPIFPLYFEDTDWCRRARTAGYELVFLPDAEIVHYYNQSGQKRTDAHRLFEESLALYCLKHEGPRKLRILNRIRALTHRLSLARKGNKYPYPFENLGVLRQSSPVCFCSEAGEGDFLLQISPDSFFIPALGGFFRGPPPAFQPSVWKRLGRGRYFARWMSMKDGTVKKLWTWVKG